MPVLMHAGFTAQDTHTFTVDTTPPVAAINTTQVADPLPLTIYLTLASQGTKDQFAIILLHRSLHKQQLNSCKCKFSLCSTFYRSKQNAQQQLELHVLQVNQGARPRRAVFTFTATDLSPVNLQCKLSGNASGGHFVGVETLGAWETCSSPQVCNSTIPPSIAREPADSIAKGVGRVGGVP